MLCDACGEEFAGFRHEEIDFYAAGTAVSTRESQSSQARIIREKIKARRDSIADGSLSQSRPFVNHELLLCEAVILSANKLAAALIELRCVSDRIMAPLFELITHWVARRHAGKKGVVGRGTVFRPSEVLALVALAALYVRSPMLPRDLCRMVVAEEVPFPGFGIEDLPDHIRKSEVVTALFAPMVVPVPGDVVGAANILARDQHAWPPIRKFFGNKEEGSGPCRFTGSWDSFPVAHVQVTLLRLSRLLGLPDEFGARVLRFIELRRIASRMCSAALEARDKWWEEQAMDSVVLGDNLREEREGLPKMVRKTAYLSEFPTDASVQVDFINTMRLCYGTSRKKTDERETANRELRKEWENCMEAMETWLRIGNPEDIEYVQWTPKTPSELSHTKGEEIRNYADMVDNLLTDMGESTPELWGKYVAAFAEIGDSWQPDKDRNEEGNRKRTCVYDVKPFESRARCKIREGKKEMDNECGYDVLTGTRRERRPLIKMKDVLRQRGSMKKNEKIGKRKAPEHRAASAEEKSGDIAKVRPNTDPAAKCYAENIEIKKEPDTHRASREEFLKEPMGIGLSWTILRHFFAGSNVVVGDLHIERLPSFVQNGLLQACNSGMKMVIMYVLWLKGKVRYAGDA